MEGDTTKKRCQAFQHPAGLLWRTPEIACGNVDTLMVAAPNRPNLLGQWTEGVYEGDYGFIASTVERCGGHASWHEDVVGVYRPT